ncbi:MAG TPA: cyanophycin synthetase, partial [Paludibacteraceae bacterium]|nr:cyanophycin synthetase [Paludibacteraceae bacterium]
NEFTQAIGEKFVGKVIWYGESTINNCGYNLSGFKPLGLHNRLNMLATIHVAEEIGMSTAEIQEQIPNIIVPKGRLNLILGISGSKLIDDTYNASPVSTKYAIDTLVKYPSKRRIAILGDMLGLGTIEIQEHEKIGKYVAENPIDVFIGVGPLMKKAVEIAKKTDIESYHLENSAKFKQELFLHLDINSGDTILVKGSQGIRMEKITEVLMEEPEKAPQLLVRQDIRWK